MGLSVTGRATPTLASILYDPLSSFEPCQKECVKNLYFAMDRGRGDFHCSMQCARKTTNGIVDPPLSAGDEAVPRGRSADGAVAGDEGVEFAAASAGPTHKQIGGLISAEMRPQ